MTEKKELPTIQIKGKSYILVKDRVIAFNEQHPNGSIRTQLVPSSIAGLYIIKAICIPDVKNLERFATGHSQAMMGGTGVNATAALENAETSAIGRAIALATSIGVIDSIASADEIHKATAPVAPVATGQVHSTRCPICNGSMWDNRGKKTNPKAPDFKCQTQNCKGVIWPPKPVTAPTPEPEYLPDYQHENA